MPLSAGETKFGPRLDYCSSWSLRTVIGTSGHPLEPFFKVNLIPYNPTGAYEGSSRGAIAAFRAALEEHGVRVTVRLTRGRDIDAACGQLAAKALAAAAER